MSYVNQNGQVRVGVRGWVPVFGSENPGTPNTIDQDSTNFIIASGISDSVQTSAIETLVSDLKTYGLWTKMKAIYPFVGGSAASHKFNLKDPRDLDAAYRLVFNGGWIHSSNGAKPNGTTGYADTKLAPNVMAQNSIHASFYSRTDITGSYWDLGAYNAGGGVVIGPRYQSGTSLVYMNIKSADSMADNNPTIGLYMGNRTSSTTNTLFRNGVIIVNGSKTSFAPISLNIYLGADNEVAVVGYSPREQAFASIGDGLTDIEAANFYIAVQKFQTTLGRHVGTPYVSDPDAISFLMAAGITDGTQAAAINTLVIRMKADGVWTKMKAVYPFVGGTAASHKWNLKDPRDLDSAYRLTFYGGGIHSSTGYQPNGSTGYAHTHLVPSSRLVSTSGFGFYSRTNSIVGAQADMGALYYFPIQAFGSSALGTTRYFASNSNDYSSFTDTDTRGFYQTYRTDSTTVKSLKNTTLYSATLSYATPNLDILIGARNEIGVAQVFSLKEFAFAYVQENFTDSDATTFYTAVQAYQTTLGRQVNIPVVSDTDAQTFLNAANITSFQQASAVNKLVVDLKAAGVWSKMKAIYPFVGGSAVSHKFNLKDPRDLDSAYRLVFNGGWTHTGTGAKPNGSNTYANTYFNPTVQSLSTASQHLSYYSRTNIIENAIEIGAISSANVNFLGLYVSSTSGTRAGLASSVRYNNSVVVDTRGLFIVSRTDTSNIKVHVNGSTQASQSVPSTGNDNFSIYIGAYGALTPDLFSSKEAAFASIGDGLTDAEATSLYTAVQTYQTSLGRQVTTPIYNNGLVLNLDAGNANSYPGTGATWFDLASGNNGTLTNGPTYDTTNGGSLLFDGVNDFSGHPIINFGTSSVSWSFWIKPSRYVSTFESFIGQGMYNVNGGGMIFGGLRNDTGTRRIQFSISSDPNSVNSKSIIIDNAYTTNTWMNLTITYNSSTRDLFMYINGVKQSVTTNVNGNFNNTSIQQSLTPTNTTGRMLSLCMYDESRTLASFNGNMATTQIYFRSLSDTEVLNYFNSTRGRFGL